VSEGSAGAPADGQAEGRVPALRVTAAASERSVNPACYAKQTHTVRSLTAYRLKRRQC
jgi:hypothetical protein